MSSARIRTKLRVNWPYSAMSRSRNSKTSNSYPPVQRPRTCSESIGIFAFAKPASARCIYGWQMGAIRAITYPRPRRRRLSRQRRAAVGKSSALAPQLQKALALLTCNGSSGRQSRPEWFSIFISMGTVEHSLRTSQPIAGECTKVPFCRYIFTTNVFSEHNLASCLFRLATLIDYCNSRRRRDCCAQTIWPRLAFPGSTSPDSRPAANS